MRILGISLAVLAVTAVAALGAPGDQWVLQIHHLDNSGAFTLEPGVGYAGPTSSGNAAFSGTAALRASAGAEGVTRVYWELSGLSVNNGTPVPATTEQYTIEFWGVPDNGHNSWQPVESQFHGAGGETFPIEPSIPWAGQFSTNHQYLSNDGSDVADWHPEGPGPQGPVDDTFTSAGNGSRMWLTSGSWLYAKWDFGFPIDRSWSAIRLTQVPEPTAGMVMLLGGGLTLLRRRRRA